MLAMQKKPQPVQSALTGQSIDLYQTKAHRIKINIDSRQCTPEDQSGPNLSDPPQYLPINDTKLENLIRQKLQAQTQEQLETHVNQLQQYLWDLYQKGEQAQKPKLRLKIDKNSISFQQPPYQQSVADPDLLGIVVMDEKTRRAIEADGPPRLIPHQNLAKAPNYKIQTPTDIANSVMKVVPNIPPAIISKKENSTKQSLKNLWNNTGRYAYFALDTLCEIVGVNSLLRVTDNWEKSTPSENAVRIGQAAIDVLSTFAPAIIKPLAVIAKPLAGLLKAAGPIFKTAKEAEIAATKAADATLKAEKVIEESTKASRLAETAVETQKNSKGAAKALTTKNQFKLASEFHMYKVRVGNNKVSFKLDMLDRPRLVKANLKTVLRTSKRSSKEIALQRKIGKMGKVGDEGGHIIARRFIDKAVPGNLFPQNRNLNRSAYKKLENMVADMLNEVYEVRIAVKPIYTGLNKRPDRIEISFNKFDPILGDRIKEYKKVFQNEAGQKFNKLDIK